MRLNYAGGSLLLFGLSILFLLMLTVFESALVGMSVSSERLLTFLALVLVPILGVVLGILSLTGKEGRTWLAMIGIVLNGLFALFHLFVVMFAG